MLSCRADYPMGGKNSVNNRCRIAKHFRPKLKSKLRYFIGTSSHCVFSNTIQNLPCSGPRTRSRWGIRTGMRLNRLCGNDASIVALLLPSSQLSQQPLRLLLR
jgi:hypothetical protein